MVLFQITMKISRLNTFFLWWWMKNDTKLTKTAKGKSIPIVWHYYVNSPHTVSYCSVVLIRDKNKNQRLSLGRGHLLLISHFLLHRMLATYCSFLIFLLHRMLETTMIDIYIAHFFFLPAESIYYSKLYYYCC